VQTVRQVHLSLSGQGHCAFRAGAENCTFRGADSYPCGGRKTIQIVEQVTDIARHCVGCGTCTLVCPNEAIEPEFNPQNKLLHTKQRGDGYKRGGRRNDPSISTLDRLKFTRISMLTDPRSMRGGMNSASEALLGRVLPPDELPLTSVNGELAA